MAPSITEEDALEFKNAFGCCLQELLTSELHEKYKKNLELFNHKNKGRGNNRSSHSNNNNNSHLQGKREPLTITKTTQITMESVANDMFLSNKKLSLFDAWQEICSNGIVGQKYLSQDSIERTKGLYADWAKNSLVKEAFDGDLPFLTLKIKVHTAITQSGVRNQHVGSWEETKMALEKALDGQVIFEDCSDSAILSELEAKGVECNSGGVASTEQKDDDLITNGEDNTDTDGHDSDLPYCGIPREEAFITSLLAQFNSGKDDGGKLVFDWATFSEEAAKLYNAPPSRVCFLRGCLDKKPTHSLVVDAAYESPRKKVSLTRKESTTEGASEIKKLASVERKKKKGQTGPNNPHYIEIFDDESDASPVKRIQSPRKCKAEQKCKAENKEPAAKRRQSPRKCKEKIDPTTVMARRMAKRIAIGEEVYKGECEVGLADGMLELKAKNSESGIEVDLNDRNVIGIKYFRAENEEVTHTSLGWTTWRYNCSFLAFQVIPTVENQLDRNYPKFISSTDKEAGYESMVVVEFRGKWNEFLTEIVKVIGVNSNWVEDLSWTDSTKYRTALDNNDNEIVLIYPFSGDHDEMETATKGLHEAKDAISINDDGHDICKVRKGRRQTFLTILETNMDRLVNGEWLNDTLIDFWIQWILRKVTRHSKIIAFDSQLFRFMWMLGPRSDYVAKFTNRINIFEKAILLIPVNMGMHWSLCVVVNPGSITNNEKAACVIHLDSWLGIHDTEAMAVTVREWLNEEWKRVMVDDSTVNPFDKITVFEPKVISQDNTFDCGLYVCKHAHCLLKMAETSLCGEESFVFNLELFRTCGFFKFRREDITRLREEMKILIMKLSPIFKAWKKKDSERKKRKRRR